jgi:hypothetical protein
MDMMSLQLDKESKLLENKEQEYLKKLHETYGREREAAQALVNLKYKGRRLPSMNSTGTKFFQVV